MPAKPPYRRVLLKLSGEALMGQHGFGLDPEAVERIAEEVRVVHQTGAEVCLVIGAGNIFRGVQLAAERIERVTADYMGMLATVINALGVQSVLESKDVTTRVLSAIPMSSVCEPYIRRRAVRHMEKGRVVIFAAGTGNPFFTTDTAAALRAVEMGCDALLKGTQVDGVYDSDPKQNPDAKRYERLTFHEVISRDLKVMDTSAVALARENGVPILVFSIHNPGSFADVVAGRGRYTIIEGDTA
jgi:uridylate kinase